MTTKAKQHEALIVKKDNKKGAVAKLIELNKATRTKGWPFPFDTTTHTIRKADARDLGWIPSRSVHLVVTSPPYWTLKQYESNTRQLGEIESYEFFLDELDKVWGECALSSRMMSSTSSSFVKVASTARRLRFKRRYRCFRVTRCETD